FTPDFFHPANPDLPNYDIFMAKVTVAGLAPGTGGTLVLPDDRFEPNETADNAHNFGTLAAPQNFRDLTINQHANGFFDNDWYRWTMGEDATLDVRITYNLAHTGDLHLRFFTLDARNNLVQLGASQRIGVTTQIVSAKVVSGEPIFVWVYGFNHALG